MLAWRRWGPKCTLAVTLVLAATLASPARPVWACSCAPRPEPHSAFINSGAVFAGTVTGIVDRGRYTLLDELRQWLGQPPRQWMEPRVVTLNVTTSWKTVRETPVTVATGAGGGDCGFAFAVGGQYLVYGYYAGGELLTNMCLRTAALAQAGTDLTYLQTLPTVPVTPARTAQPLLYLAGGAAALGALALAALAAYLWHRRRTQTTTPHRRAA